MPVLPPLRSEEDPQRYWRRRANRRVRKARLTRTALRWSLVLVANAVIGGMLFSAGWRIFDWLTTTDEFALERIEVDGARRSSPELFRLRLQGFVGRNLLELNLQELVAAAERDPWALEVSAKRILPHTVRIAVIERTPSAVVLIGGIAHVVDSTGYVVGPSGVGFPDDLPVLKGFDGMEGDALVNALRRGTRMIDALRSVAGPWMDEISEIDVSGPDRVVVRTVEPGPLILLDPGRVTRNLPQYLELRRDIARRVGDARYVDLRWSDRISVMPVIEIQES